MTIATERAQWNVHTTVEKWHRAADHAAGHAPDEVVHAEGNALMNAGITRMLNLLIGAGGQALDSTHARVGVGDGDDAADAAQTDLQGSSKRFALMEATFPSVDGQKVSFKGQFESGEANFAWEEFCIDAGTADGDTVVAPMLNRKVQNFGTKASGAVWTLQVDITIA